MTSWTTLFCSVRAYPLPPPHPTAPPSCAKYYSGSTHQARFLLAAPEGSMEQTAHHLVQPTTCEQLRGRRRPRGKVTHGCDGRVCAGVHRKKESELEASPACPTHTVLFCCCCFVALVLELPRARPVGPIFVFVFSSRTLLGTAMCARACVSAYVP